MTTTTRGRHRKLRRNILHTIIATALLAGTFTVVDQVTDVRLASAAEATGQAGQPMLSSDGGSNTQNAVTAGTDGKYYTVGNAGLIRYSATGSSESVFWDGNVGSTITAGGGLLFLGYASKIAVYTQGTTTLSYEFGSGQAKSIAYGPSGKLFVAVGSDLRIYNSTSAGANPNFTLPMGGTIDEVKIQIVGGIEYALVSGAFGVKRVVSGSGALDGTFTNVPVLAGGAFTGLAVDASDNTFLVGDSNNVYRVSATGSSISAALMTTNRVVRAIAIDSRQRLYIPGGSGVLRFSATGAADGIFNANANSGTGFISDSLAIGAENRIATTSTNNNSPRWFRLYRGDSAPPTAPTLSNLIPSDSQVTITATKSGTVPTSSITIFAVEDPTKFCTVSAIIPASGVTNLASAQSCAVTGLNNGTAYTFKAIAYNLDEPSSETAASAAVTPMDIAGPVFQSAAVNSTGLKLTLTYSEPINSNIAATSNFIVKNGASTVAVTAVTANGSTVELTLATPIGAGLTASVAYTAPTAVNDASNSAIQDQIGNDSLSLATTNITAGNNQSTVDQTAPTVSSVTTNLAGTEVTLTFNEALSTVNPPLSSQFTIANTGGYPTTVTNVAVDGTTVVLTLSSPISATGTKTVSYTASTPVVNNTTNVSVQDVVGNDAIAIVARTITNSSTVDQASPTSTAMTNASNGQTLTLTLSETLSSASPPLTSQFSITTNGYPTSVQSLTVSGATVVLTLSTPLGSGKTASVTYTAPSAVNDVSNLALQDTAGNDAATFTRSLSPNSSTVDQNAPTLVRTDVNGSGSAVILTFNEALNATSASLSDFVITSDGAPVTISSVTISGSTVVLTTATTLEKNDVVRVSYTAPTVNNTASNSAIQDTAGNDASSIALGVVTANGSGTDTKAPVLSATVPLIGTTGLTMTLTFNETLSSTKPLASNFTVLVDGVSVVPSSVTITGSNSIAILNFSPAIPQGRTVTVAYTSPGADNAPTDAALQDSIGNNTATFSAQAVTNNSTVDKTAPLLSNVAIPTLVASGAALTLTYNETLATVLAAAGNFTVTVGGTPVTISSVTRPTTTTIQLNLATAVEGGNVVTVAYTAPVSSDLANNNAVQDTAGNDAASFTAQPVGNNSTMGRPVLTSIVVGATGGNVTFNYNKSGTTHPSFAGFTWLVNGEPTALVWGNGSSSSSTFITYQPISPVLNAGDVITATYVEPNTNSTTLKSVTDFVVTNNSTVPRDVTAPVFSSANVNWSGTVLTLNYNETLGSTLPPMDAFDVLVGGIRFSVASMTASGSALTLNLGSSIEAGKAVTISYTPPTPTTSKLNAAIQDAAGNDSIALTNQAVTNSSTAGPDTAKPNLVSFVGNASTVTLTFNETLGSAIPRLDTFAVFVGNSQASVTGVTISGNRVILTLGSTLPAGEVVTVGYTAPIADNVSTTNLALQDFSGNDAASFSTNVRPATNIAGDFVDQPTVDTYDCDGSWNANRTKQITLPSGFWYRIGVTGNSVCINDGYEPLSGRGGLDSHFWQPGLTNQGNIFLETAEPSTNPASPNYCAPSGDRSTIAPGDTTLCPRLGRIKFSFPTMIKNPVFSFAGLGSGSGSVTSFTELDLITPNLTLTKLSGTNIQVINGTHIEPIVKRPDTHCNDAGSGYGAIAPAGCGSFRLNGYVQEFELEVSFGATGVLGANDFGNHDHWNIMMSFEEDFGLAPVSFDAPVASHTLNSELKLGAIVDSDNTTRLYSTTNDDSVSAGTPIVAGSDDGVPQTAWNALTLDKIGQTLTVPVSLSGVDATAYLCAWIDFNRDGQFASIERSCSPTLVAGTTTANISWTVPPNLEPGLIYARVRLSYETLPFATGKVGSGEVEDYSLVVGPPPMTANPDTTSGLMGQQQTSSLVTNDVASSGASVVTSSVRLCNASATPAEVSPNCTATTVVVSGVGTYTVNTLGEITFTPLPNYVGTPPALSYSVSDSGGTSSASTYTPTVVGKPITSPDAITTNWDTNQNYVPRTNDTAAAGTTLISNSTKICVNGTAPASCTGTSLTVAGEGNYTVNSDGSVTFDPLPTFSGTATPIQYTITDSRGQLGFNTITPTINPPVAPTATPDTVTTNWDVSQTYTPLSNDTANASFPLVTNSVKLCASNETPNSCTQTTLTIAGQGTYTVNPDGSVIFDPVPTFTGTATPIKYQAKDSLNRFIDSTISPIIGAPPAPIASPDAQSTGYDITQSYTPSSNDTVNVNFPLDVTSVKLCQPATTNPPVSAEVAPNCSLTSLTTPDGVYTVNTVTGFVGFNPAQTFSGTVASPISYQVTDSINRTVSSTITPTIGAPPGPTAVVDTSTGNYDTNQTIDPLSNDPDNPAIPLLPATLKFCGIDPVENPNNCTQTTLFVPGQGSYVVDPATGLVTFDPLPTFSGTATPVRYQAANDSGQFVNSTITVTVGPPPMPVANPDSSSSAMRVVQTINPLGNDTAGVSPIPLDPTSVKLCGINPVETPNDCTKTTLVVPDKGTFTVDLNTGRVSFTPVDTWHGTVPTINYTVADTLGREVTSQIKIVVLPPPAMAAITDLGSGNYNTPQTITPLTNDSPGDLTAPELYTYTTKGSVEKDPTSVRFCGPDDPTTANVDESVLPNCVATSTTTPAGTYVVNATTGVVTFTPVATFTGTDPNAPTYQTCNNVTGTWVPGTPPDTCASALIILTVGAPPLPVANPDTSSNAYDINQLINPLTNDTANANFPLDPTTVKLCGAGDVAPNCTKTTLTVLNEGTYTVNPLTGVITFDPLPTFTGVATPISYKVTDSLDRSVSSTITATVGEPPLPTAANDANSGPFDVDQIIYPLTNDSPIAAFPFDQTTVKLCAMGVSPPNCTSLGLDTADGVYTVNSNGTVTFNPDSDFTGVVTQLVTYQVTEIKTNGRVASATITPTVGAPPAPVAVSDAQTQPYDTNQTYTPTSNDTSNQNFTVSATSVKLCGPDDLATAGINESVPPNCVATSLTTTDGVYTVNPANGEVTFNPDADFTGMTTVPVKYQATDSLNRVINSTITPTVGPPPVATAVADAQTQPYDTNQTYTPTSNDTANVNFPINTNSVKLCPAGISPPNCLATELTTADGVYTVDPATGNVTFNPDPDFTGVAAVPVIYQATDSINRVINSTITPTVGPPSVATAVPDAQTQPYDTNQTYTPTTNDTANGNFPITANSLKLCPAGISPPNCTATEVTTTDGVYTVNPTTGAVTFNPDPDFTGVTSVPVTYQVADSINRVINSTITPTVGTPPPPTPTPDTSSAAWDITQTKNVLTNDLPGSSSYPLVASTVRLCGADDPATITLDESVSPNCVAVSLTIPNQGTYTVNSDGTISFDPLPTFEGDATAVTYQASDSLSRTFSTTYAPTVTPPPPPTLVPDTTSGLINISQSIDVLTNTAGTSDSAAQGLSLNQLSVELSCPTTPLAPACVVNDDGSVTITGQGTYSNGGASLITFTPVNNYTGTAKPVVYTVSDSVGQSSSTTYTPTITPPPVANPDVSTGVQGAIQTLSPVGNDRPGGGASTTLYPDTRAQVPSGIFLCAANQPPPDCAASSVIVNDINNVILGVLTVAASGLVTFTPEPNFIGTTPPIGYQIPDNLGQMAYSTITITVLPPPAPSATLDTGSAEFNNPVTLRPWINDSAGAVPSGSSLPAPNLVATSIKLCGDNTTFIPLAGTPADCAETKIKTVEGTYEVNATTGEVVFTPVAGFTGTVKYPPTYQIWNDWTGLGGVKSATALLVPTISPPVAPGGPSGPVATVDITKTKPGTSVVLNPVANDKPGSAALDPATIRLCGASEISPACTRMSVTTLDGRYVVEPRTGQVTFTPRDGFTGQATIPYIIKDGLGMQTASHLIITVEDSAVVKKPKKKTGLAKTGGHRPDMLLLLGILAMVGAGGLRVASRKR